ncbi:hypothetical protein BX666DRAFT_1439779 [Dichotomocladium elegans]|nr:hypothetical protein BX666DRAFT_1439779 [Dichotomocladium elegans]
MPMDSLSFTLLCVLNDLLSTSPLWFLICLITRFSSSLVRTGTFMQPIGSVEKKKQERTVLFYTIFQMIAD